MNFFRKIKEFFIKKEKTEKEKQDDEEQLKRWLKLAKEEEQLEKFSLGLRKQQEKKELEERIKLSKAEYHEQRRKERAFEKEGEKKAKKKERKKKTLRKQEEKKEEKEKPSRLIECVEDIEKNQEKLLAQKEFFTPKLRIINDGAILNFKNKEFLFCKEGLEAFRKFIFNETKEKYFELIIDEDGYLSRQHRENDNIQNFHRLLMLNEVEKFAKENGINFSEVEVHHIDLTKTNNRKENLQVMTAEEHKKLHLRLKFSGTDEQFEEWYNREFKGVNNPKNSNDEQLILSIPNKPIQPSQEQ